jgi:hypothetical protein
MVKVTEHTAERPLPLYLHFDVVQYIVRGYVDPDGYAKKVPYDLLFTVLKPGDGTATVLAMKGVMNRPTREEIVRRLAAEGVHTARVVRHGQMKEISTGLNKGSAA